MTVSYDEYLSYLIPGYSTGSIIKKCIQRREYVSQCYRQHAQDVHTQHTQQRVVNFTLQAKRAVSLPDMLREEPASNYTAGNIRQGGNNQPGGEENISEI